MHHGDFLSIGLKFWTPIPRLRGSILGSDSFLMKFAGDGGSSTENRRHADGLSNFVASTEWLGV
jgi:hypothetical protein